MNPDISMTTPNRPAATTNGPSVVDAMKSNPPAPLAQQPVATTGNDTTKGLLQMGPGGDVFKQGEGIAPSLEPAAAKPSAADNNTAGVLKGSPAAADEVVRSRRRHAPPPRNLGRTKTR